MKKIYTILISITGLLLSTTPLFAISSYGYLGLCVYKTVPNSSNNAQVYSFKTDGDANCMTDGKNETATVSVPPNAPSGLYCSNNTFEVKESLSFSCLSEHSYLGISFSGKGGGASVSTAGSLRFYGPANYNELYFEGGVDKSLHLCLGKGDCSSSSATFHNGQHVYAVYDGDK